MSENTNTPEVQNTPPQEVKSPLVPEKRSKKNRVVLLIILGILFISVIATAIWIFFFTDIFTKDTEKENTQNQEKTNNPEEETEENGEKNNNNEDETEEEEEKVKLVTFEGDTFNADLPSNWSMKEYYNGEGTKYLTNEMKFTGLTGMKIFKNNVEMFYLQSIYGIGFSGCPNYARFADENPTYYTQLLKDNLEVGEELKVTDYTNSDFEEFEWLGVTFRRVGTDYNYDTVPDNSYFEPSCVGTIVSFEGLQFFPEEGPAANSYDYGLTDSAVLEDLTTIDSILESMTLNN